MRRALPTVLLAFGLLSALPMLALARSANRDIGGSFFVFDGGWLAGRIWPQLRRAHVLQLDSNAAGAALTLLVGSVAVVAGRRRNH